MAIDLGIVSPGIAGDAQQLRVAICCRVAVQLVDDSGRALDAEFLLEPDGGHLALVMESRSGMLGSRAPRNPDYNRALTVLLARLGALDAVLADALVDSRHTQNLGLPETDRRLVQAPIRLALAPDPGALDVIWVRLRPRSRKRLTQPKAVIPPSG